MVKRAERRTFDNSSLAPKSAFFGAISVPFPLGAIAIGVA
jgi:hypothetical protein